MRNRTHRTPEQGYNLVELIIAIALLGTLLISILTLFVVGRRNVYSGKQLTRANSVTTQVLEDLQPLAVPSLNTQFLITSSTSLTDPTINGVAYNDVIVRTTTDVTKEYTGADPPAAKYLTRWKNLLGTGTEKFRNPKVTLVIDPDDMKTGTDPTSAAIVKIRVITEWDEVPARHRVVTAEVVKFNREF